MIDSTKWQLSIVDSDKYLPHIAFYFDADEQLLPAEILRKTSLVEIENSGDVNLRIKELKKLNPEIVVSVRVELDSDGISRAVELSNSDVEVIHVVADKNGKQTGVSNPLHIKNMIRNIHKSLIENGTRDDITIIAGGGIALPEHVTKGLLCGTDLVSVELPLLISLECQLCEVCSGEKSCPSKIAEAEYDYSVGRMTNLVAAWHDQIVEMMGAMGIRDARRLRGDVGRAMFFEQLEEETFGKLFGTRKQA